MKRKCLIAVIALLMTAMLVPSLAGAYTLYVKTGNGGSVNVRQAASTKSEVIDKLPYGSKVEAVGSEGGWTSILLPGCRDISYVMSKYLVNTHPGEAPADDDPEEATVESLNFKSFKLVTPYDAYIRASHPGGFVNQRWAPGMSACVQQRVNDGSFVEVIAEGKDWIQVRDSATGFTGFMKSCFVIRADGAVGVEK